MVTKFELPVILLVELDLLLYNQIALRNVFYDTIKYKRAYFPYHGWLFNTQFFLIYKNSLSLTFSS